MSVVPGLLTQFLSAPSVSDLARIEHLYARNIEAKVFDTPNVFFEPKEKTDGQDVKIDVQLGVRHVFGPSYEVVVSVDIKCSNGQKEQYILKVEYCALIRILKEMDGMDSELVKYITMVEIPSQIFPFVRNQVHFTTAGMGFPPLLLGHIVDFKSEYIKNSINLKNQI